MAGEGRLAGRAALVTGGSRGIGFACASALAAEGARVAVLARQPDVLTQSAGSLVPAAIPIACDLANPDDVERAIIQVHSAFGSAPDIIVNSAGQFLMAPVERISPADFDRLLLVNLTGPFALIRAMLPELRLRGRGHVVSVGSLADRVALPGNAAYAASKFGLRALHEVLRGELRGSGVRATLVSPAHVATQLWEDSSAATVAPRGDMLSPEAVAAAVTYAVTAPPEVNVDELRLSRA